uniref:GDP-Man:Man(3)GlcNAc(2)-PP-Dol alpha-1,2-mannosyltransferase n=1 Tax=Vannella robusta TaxID=1487602 RepID=A0A7S4MFI8_9EUKA|mmetsp:Transcript_20681/g.26150  ORF Transcript_20681/g.26150 Transcript_20681/m.26150 type:complete len:487 (+) Transcript_20681:2-1462(+)
MVSFDFIRVGRMSWFAVLLFLFFGCLCYVTFGVVASFLVLRLIFSGKKPRTQTIGFFHPYCNDGGGGERVLWMMVAGIQQKYPNYQCIIYSGDTDASAAQILEKVRNRFNIHLNEDNVKFCFLFTRKWLEAQRYPVFTMVGQSLGSIIVTFEALGLCTPHLFIDSMGYSYSLWIARLLGKCKVAAYVHYPTISTDMLSKVQTGTKSYNNKGSIAKSPLLRFGKVLYYRLFAFVYGIAGRACSLVFVNSSWTRSHIDSLWKMPQKTKILYPPCNTSHLSSLPLENREQGTIISIAQFRPEKDHALQIKAFAKLRNENSGVQQGRLVLIGSCRHQKDRDIVDSLQSLAEELGVNDSVDFKVNVTYEELLEWYGKAQYGIHTMWCEHFGIGIVELMASGVIVVAHNSGGPKMDIVKEHNGQRTGFLASTEEEYASELYQMFSLSQNEQTQIQEAARERTKLFSDETFKENFITEISPIIDSLEPHMKIQ